MRLRQPPSRSECAFQYPAIRHLVWSGHDTQPGPTSSSRTSTLSESKPPHEYWVHCFADVLRRQFDYAGARDLDVGSVLEPMEEPEACPLSFRRAPTADVLDRDRSRRDARRA